MSFKESANASTMFLLRGLGLNVDILNKYGFISAYIDDINHDIKYESSVFLLFKPESIQELNGFVSKEYKRTTYLKEDYDYEGGYVVLAYKFPEKYLADYEKFLMGEYSKFSDMYKSLFPMTATVKDKKGVVVKTYDLTYHIFKKSDSLRRHLSIQVYGARKGEVDDDGEPIPERELPKSTELWSSPDLKIKDMLDIERVRKELMAH